MSCSNELEPETSVLTLPNLIVKGVKEIFPFSNLNFALKSLNVCVANFCMFNSFANLVNGSNPETEISLEEISPFPDKVL